MKSVTSRAFPHVGLAMAGGILVTLGLLLFINVLANYRAHATEPRPLLVVDLTAWPMPVKQEKQAPPPKPEKQPMPKRPVVKKPPPPPEPEISPQAKKIVEEILPAPKEHETTEEIVEENDETVEPVLSEPTPPMLIEPAEDALPNPVPIFKLTQAPRFLHREVPVYPETMRTQGISGVVKLEALIDKEGRVRKVNILKSAGKHFDEAARRAILASSFYPAEVENEPVAVLLRLPVRFDLL
ncbi:MAG: TonB family protein [Gammaproteobacteria bacterium]|nr:TonB family protein [Gammaproteobacteria bacterium]